MKQSIFIILGILFILSITNSAIAGNNRHYGNGHNNDYNNHRGHNNHRRHNNNSYGRYNRHHGHYPGAVLGGLLVGGIIASSFNTPYYRKVVYTNSNPPNVISGNNFLLKSNGDCFLITEGANGSQIHSTVPVSNCR